MVNCHGVRLPEGAEQIYRGICALASVCDGAVTDDRVGYNAKDSDFCHSISRKPLSTWTPKMVWVAWKVLRHYRRQLSDHGIDWDAIPPPPPPEKASRGIITSSASGWFDVRFQYDPAIVAAVREIHGRRYDPNTRSWTIPATPSNAEAVSRLAEKYQLDIDPSASRLIVALKTSGADQREREQEERRRLEEERRALEAEMAEMIAASSASDADLTVPGLRGELMPFQRAGVAYALRTKRCLIADQPGLGKTIQALATIQSAGAYPAVVVMPAVVKYNWRSEIRRWLPHVSVEVLNGQRGRYSSDITLVNYDVLYKHVDSLVAMKPKAVVLDESHAVKNPKARRSQSATRLVKESAPDFVLLLSGTPVMNRPAELVHQLKIMDRLNEFGGWKAFMSRYCGLHRTRFGFDVSGARNLDELNKRLRASCMVRRRKEDVLKELPAKRHASVLLQLEDPVGYKRAEADVIAWIKEQAAQDRRIREEARAWAETLPDSLPPDERLRLERQYIASRVDQAAERAKRAEHLVGIEKLKQVAAHGKLNGVKEWIREFLDSDEKLVVFAHHRDVVEALAAEFKTDSISGDDSAERRDAVVRRFQTDPEARLLVCNIQAGGVGITLTSASNVAIVELPWTPAAVDQAVDRVHRIGQESSVTAWFLLASDTIDEQIYELLEAKRKVVTAATDGGRAAQESILNDLVDVLAARTI